MKKKLLSVLLTSALVLALAVVPTQVAFAEEEEISSSPVTSNSVDDGEAETNPAIVLAEEDEKDVTKEVESEGSETEEETETEEDAETEEETEEPVIPDDPQNTEVTEEEIEETDGAEETEETEEAEPTDEPGDAPLVIAEPEEEEEEAPLVIAEPEEEEEAPLVIAEPEEEVLDVPKTGDDTNVTLWVCLGSAGTLTLAAAAALLLKKRI